MADEPKAAISAIAFFTELPSACPVCGAPVIFTHRTPQGYDYYGLRCTGEPAHSTNFGQHKADGSLFYKQREPWQTLAQGRDDYEEEAYR